LAIQMKRGTGFAPRLEGDFRPDRAHSVSSFVFGRTDEALVSSIHV
jgi:hypothetical protein